MFRRKHRRRRRRRLRRQSYRSKYWYLPRLVMTNTHKRKVSPFSLFSKPLEFADIPFSAHNDTYHYNPEKLHKLANFLSCLYKRFSTLISYNSLYHYRTNVYPVRISTDDFFSKYFKDPDVPINRIVRAKCRPLPYESSPADSPFVHSCSIYNYNSSISHILKLFRMSTISSGTSLSSFYNNRGLLHNCICIFRRIHRCRGYKLKLMTKKLKNRLLCICFLRLTSLYNKYLIKYCNSSILSLHICASIITSTMSIVSNAYVCSIYVASLLYISIFRVLYSKYIARSLLKLRRFFSIRRLSIFTRICSFASSYYSGMRIRKRKRKLKIRRISKSICCNTLFSINRFFMHSDNMYNVSNSFIQLHNSFSRRFRNPHVYYKVRKRRKKRRKKIIKRKSFYFHYWLKHSKRFYNTTAVRKLICKRNVPMSKSFIYTYLKTASSKYKYKYKTSFFTNIHANVFHNAFIYNRIFLIHNIASALSSYSTLNTLPYKCNIFAFVKSKFNAHLFNVRKSHRRILTMLKWQINNFFSRYFNAFNAFYYKCTRRSVTFFCRLFFALFKKFLRNRRNVNVRAIKRHLFRIYAVMVSRHRSFVKRQIRRNIMLPRSRRLIRRRIKRLNRIWHRTKSIKKKRRLKRMINRLMYRLLHIMRKLRLRDVYFRSIPRRIRRRIRLRILLRARARLSKVYSIKKYIDKARYVCLFMKHFNISWSYFSLLCRRVMSTNGSVQDVFMSLESSIFHFMSVNFFTQFNSHVTTINNKHMSGYLDTLFHALSIGDVIEFRSNLIKQKSIYLESYFLLFTIFDRCKLNIVRSLIYSELLRTVRPLLLTFITSRSIRAYNGNTHKTPYTFYSRWSFKKSRSSLFHRRHYYFACLLYKVYMPWFTLNLSTFPRNRHFFFNFIHKLEFTNKLYITNVFHTLSTNVSVCIYTHSYINMKFYIILLLSYHKPLASRKWVSASIFELLIRSYLAKMTFSDKANTFRKWSKPSHIYDLRDKNCNAFMDITKLSKSFFSKQDNNIYLYDSLSKYSVFEKKSSDPLAKYHIMLNSVDKYKGESIYLAHREASRWRNNFTYKDRDTHWGRVIFKDKYATHIVPNVSYKNNRNVYANKHMVHLNDRTEYNKARNTPNATYSRSNVHRVHNNSFGKTVNNAPVNKAWKVLDSAINIIANSLSNKKYTTNSYRHSDKALYSTWFSTNCKNLYINKYDTKCSDSNSEYKYDYKNIRFANNTNKLFRSNISADTIKIYKRVKYNIHSNSPCSHNDILKNKYNKSKLCNFKTSHTSSRKPIFKSINCLKNVGTKKVSTSHFARITKFRATNAANIKHGAHVSSFIHVPAYLYSFHKRVYKCNALNARKWFVLHSTFLLTYHKSVSEKISRNAQTDLFKYKSLISTYGNIHATFIYNKKNYRILTSFKQNNDISIFYNKNNYVNVANRKYKKRIWTTGLRWYKYKINRRRKEKRLEYLFKKVLRKMDLTFDLFWDLDREDYYRRKKKISEASIKRDNKEISKRKYNKMSHSFRRFRYLFFRKLLNRSAPYFRQFTYLWNWHIRDINYTIHRNSLSYRSPLQRFMYGLKKRYRAASRAFNYHYKKRGYHARRYTYRRRIARHTSIRKSLIRFYKHMKQRTIAKESTKFLKFYSITNITQLHFIHHIMFASNSFIYKAHQLSRLSTFVIRSFLSKFIYDSNSIRDNYLNIHEINYNIYDRSCFLANMCISTVLQNCAILYTYNCLLRILYYAEPSLNILVIK